MRVLVVGSGGREHALAWSLQRSASVDAVFVAPGNAGTESVAVNVAESWNDADALSRLAKRERIDLIVVGPEAPLVAGLADTLTEHGFLVFGPSAAAARIEGSKSWAKQIMARANVPTAPSRTFTQVEPALQFLREFGAPCVVKADGLAAGKGVAVCETLEEAADAVRGSLERGLFGAAGATIVIEETLAGEELSVFCVTDGTTVLPLAAAQDHKRLLDADTGPNTGGMGAYSPVPHLDHLVERVVAETFEPLIETMAAQGSPFRGVLFGGFMLTTDGPKVLEFNCRFGDPEAQVLLPRLRSDAGELLMACADGSLHSVKPEWSDDAAVCVVLAGAGYPQRSDSGTVIEGLDSVVPSEDVVVFHAGTARDAQGRVVTNGGRVLGVTALGSDLARARDRAYDVAARIEFDGKQYRGDIASKGITGNQGA